MNSSEAARLVGRGLVLPREWWARQSLRARLTLLATALFSIAVITGAVLLLVLQRYALTRVLDQNAVQTARDIARQVRTGDVPKVVQPTTGGIAAVQVLDRNDSVLAASQGTDRTVSLLTPDQLAEVRGGNRIEFTSGDEGSSAPRYRAVARNVGSRTVVVLTDIYRVDDSLRILTRAALIGGPLAVLLMAAATYASVALALRPVAALRHGAADITAAGLAEQRLPVPRAQDEIHRLAVTLNAMLDRIDSATSRQRTFVGDAAHELRSPLASLRVQLEVGQRLGPEDDWTGLVDDVLVDVDRLDRLVEDLLSLARLDETGTLRREAVPLAELVTTVVGGYGQARVPVTVTTPVPSGDHPGPAVDGDPDALRRVVINLVNNAVRYAATAVDVDLVEAARSGRPGVRLGVQDDGPGIPVGERERVFDRFYRVQESRSRDTGGTGLGLPIVRDIVRNHGGRVRLTDRADGHPGLRAEVWLPLDGG
ncbi:Signal transduction histidine kinase [Jatrophihabitans endophyticus]|uniref:histidine kinase n=1 Tax=Jatrophihabitans endophyticus TaxID=1206085 RepID=A0A1M5I8C4_9ACTN|nr:ATP-binding protein [Jatrophihabitans endophyticus]SHG24170.1 Signal transduction histidine kinase [Jatrophihabitans endophyticus]